MRNYLTYQCIGTVFSFDTLLSKDKTSISPETFNLELETPLAKTKARKSSNSDFQNLFQLPVDATLLQRTCEHADIPREAIWSSTKLSASFPNGAL